MSETIFSRQPSQLLGAAKNRPIAVSDDTVNQILITKSPDNGHGFGGMSAAHDGTTLARSCQNVKSMFSWNNNTPGVKPNLSQTCVKFAVFVKGYGAVAGNPDPGVNAAFEWNDLARAIQGIEFKVNSAVIRSIPSNFHAIWTSHMLTSYSMETMNNHSACFVPITGETDNYLDPTAAVDAGSVRAIRHNKYCYAGSANKIFVMTMPLYDLLCMRSAPIAVNTLIKTFELSIQFRAPTIEAGAETFGGFPICGLTENHPSTFYVGGVEMVVACAQLSASQIQQIAQAKAEDYTEIIAYIGNNGHHPKPFSGADDITISNMKHFMAVHMFQIASTPTFDGNLVGQAGAEVLPANAGRPGQLCLIQRNAGVPMTSATRVGEGVPGLSDARISVGSRVSYPSNPLVLGDRDGVNFASRDREYVNQWLLSKHIIMSRNDTLPAPIDGFSSVLQSLYFEPQGSLPSLSDEVADLRIFLHSPVVTAAVRTIHVIPYTLHVFRINANGTVDAIIQ